MCIRDRFIGSLAEGISWLSWLNFGEAFGLKDPIVLNLGILVITFGPVSYTHLATISR